MDVASRVPGRERRQANCPDQAVVDVLLCDEERAPAGRIDLVAGPPGGMLEPASQARVGRRREALECLMIGAYEHDQRAIGGGAVVGLAPPPGEERVVALEFVVVLVRTAGAVELDEHARGS